MSSHKEGHTVCRKKKPLSHNWIVMPSKTYPDRVYFYNTVTRCSTWDNPCRDLDDGGDDNSSESSSTVQVSAASNLKNKKGKLFFHSLDKNKNECFNNDIEDYDEQDQYFDNVFNNSNWSHSKIISPSSSPESVSSESVSDSEKHSGSILLENNKKELWLHFVSTPENPTAKKSVALSDIDLPTTSRNLGQMNQSNRRERKKEKKDSAGENGKDFFSSDDCNKSSYKGSNGFTRKKVKEKPENKKKSITEKALKKISFKRTEKTPAQTRLLKLRKQNAERLKELASEFSGSVIPKNNCTDSSLRKDKNVSIFEVDEQSRSNSFGEVHLKRTDFFSNDQGDQENRIKPDCIEEMDWEPEPSNIKSDVKNVNALCQELSRTSEFSQEVFFGLNSDHSLTLPSTNPLILVLDTNIFLSNLDFVKELRDTKIHGLGYPILYVPWRTLQELDHLKGTKIETKNNNFHLKVRSAIAYLNENFKSRHPRVFGQSFEDSSKMISVDTFAPDDEILQTCIHLQKRSGDKTVILLTNDKNLESKAIISGVDAYSKDRFVKNYLNSQSNFSTKKTVLNSENNTKRLDHYICEVKEILRDFLPVFVETEMRTAFEGDWVKLAFKKPPWTLKDAMECLLKHWRSVFFLIFPKETHSEGEKLYETLFRKEPGSAEEMAEVIRTIQRLLTSIKKHQKGKSSYIDLIPDTISKLSNLLKTLGPNDFPQNGTGECTSRQNDFLQSQQVFPAAREDVDRVRNLFKDLWDSLRNFCCSVSDIVQSPGANSYERVQEIRMKVLQTLNEVGQFVVTVERIFEMNVRDINENHPLINHLNNFLIRVYPAMAPDLKGELQRCLASFFTDDEARSLLTSSLTDFNEFIQDLSKATEYLNAQTPC